jgi:hypothetical protein
MLRPHHGQAVMTVGMFQQAVQREAGLAEFGSNVLANSQALTSRDIH